MCSVIPKTILADDKITTLLLKIASFSAHLALCWLAKEYVLLLYQLLLSSWLIVTLGVTTYIERFTFGRKPDGI
jgi:hypothetical protein